MTFLVFLAAAALTGPQAGDAVHEREASEIVVAAERLRNFSLVTRTNRAGKRRCVFRRRSGDAAFDTYMCQAVLTCAETVTTAAEMEACTGNARDTYAGEQTTRHADGHQ